MLKIIISILVSCLIVGVSANFMYESHQKKELSPSEYASLYSLKYMAPELFFKELLPEIEKAMADNILTRAERDIILNKVQNLGKVFLDSAKDKTLGQNLDETIKEFSEQKDKTTKDLKQGFEETLNNALQFFQKKSEELLDSLQEPETQKTEPPQTF